MFQQTKLAFVFALHRKETLKFWEFLLLIVLCSCLTDPLVLVNNIFHLW